MTSGRPGAPSATSQGLRQHTCMSDPEETWTLHTGRTDTGGKDFPKQTRGLARRLAEWQAFWKDGILNTNAGGQRCEAEEQCTQLGGPLIRERFAKPVERRPTFPGSPEGKECGSQRGDQQVRRQLDTLTENEAPPSCPVWSPATFPVVLVIRTLEQQRTTPWSGRRQAGPAPS